MMNVFFFTYYIQRNFYICAQVFRYFMYYSIKMDENVFIFDLSDETMGCYKLWWMCFFTWYFQGNFYICEQSFRYFMYYPIIMDEICCSIWLERWNYVLWDVISYDECGLIHIISTQFLYLCAKYLVF